MKKVLLFRPFNAATEAKYGKLASGIEKYVRTQYCEDLGCPFENFSMTPENAGRFLKAYQNRNLADAFEDTDDMTIKEFPNLRRIITDFFENELHKDLI